MPVFPLSPLAKTLPLPWVPTALAAKTPPLPCSSSPRSSCTWTSAPRPGAGLALRWPRAHGRSNRSCSPPLLSCLYPILSSFSPVSCAPLPLSPSSYSLSHVLSHPRGGGGGGACRRVYVLLDSSIDPIAIQVGTFGMWTVPHHVGPDHLGLCCKCRASTAPTARRGASWWATSRWSTNTRRSAGTTDVTTAATWDRI